MMEEYDASTLKAKDMLYKKQHKTLITPTLPITIFLHAFKALYLAIVVIPAVVVVVAASN